LIGLPDVYRLFFTPGEVAEIRAMGLSGKNKAWEGFARDVVAGYFDQPQAFGEAAQALDRAGAKAVYFTLNPCKPALLARASNRLRAAGGKHCPLTADHDIVAIRWLPVDVDPRRPAEISSSRDELQTAMATGRKVFDWMMEQGFARPLVACSGNGCHLCFRLPDLPNTDETQAMIKAALAVLKAQFEDQRVIIDQKVGNPARIWKLYGTTTRKGDATGDRPHRRACIILEPEKAGADMPAGAS